MSIDPRPAIQAPKCRLRRPAPESKWSSTIEFVLLSVGGAVIGLALGFWLSPLILIVSGQRWFSGSLYWGIWIWSPIVGAILVHAYAADRCRGLRRRVRRGFRWALVSACAIGLPMFGIWFASLFSDVAYAWNESIDSSGAFYFGTTIAGFVGVAWPNPIDHCKRNTRA
ncbi:MAG: hypothetical protein KDB80_18480 [Planctomycetes bacterium]|nr:hypothetical protein [Planctomycetota bacterium]